ncbi:MAG TPA: hypothetical protein VJQ82_10595 [Terriglobales bacterium]|nr:hypothetical protein [Terriglobales bacterium]
MKRKGGGQSKLERNFWIVVIAFTLLAVLLILLEGHFEDSDHPAAIFPPRLPFSCTSLKA